MYAWFTTVDKKTTNIWAIQCTQLIIVASKGDDIHIYGYKN